MKKKRKIIFDKEPMCEFCGKEKADAFSNYGEQSGVPDWQFVGNCQNNATTYHVELKRFFSSPASTVDWLAHLHEKGWVGKSFMDMMTRFRAAAGSYGK